MSKPEPTELDEAKEDDYELNLHVDTSKIVLGHSYLAICLNWVCLPVSVLCSWFTLEPNEEAVTTHFGVYSGKYEDAGIKYATCWGRELTVISTRQKTVELPGTKVIDRSGNPLNVSAVLIYRFTEVEKVALCIEDAEAYVSNISQSTLRKVVSNFKYEVEDDSTEPCLKTDASLVSLKLCQALAKQLDGVGVDVIAFQLNEISYAPEIASAMLKRQQAEALVQARRTLVNGCTLIALDAVRSLESEGIGMDVHDKVRIVSNLLTVTCSDAQTVNNIPVGL